MTDERRRMTVYHVDQVPWRPVDQAPPRLERPAPPAAPARRRPRGVTAGRIVAAAAGIAAMLGLTASLQVAGAHTQPQGGSGAPPAPQWGHTSLRRAASSPGAGTRRQRVAAAARKAIVLTPHTVVHTVGGATSGGSGGSYAGSYSAPAAAPVATTSGSRAH
jgi:hypothetical protein